MIIEIHPPASDEDYNEFDIDWEAVARELCIIQGGDPDELSKFFRKIRPTTKYFRWQTLVFDLKVQYCRNLALERILND